ncbi:MAG: hypothetical protein K2Z81_27475, partial [Cyanobacteria bacterium]|nr:hypothetical protein [Cyanobacteriota bacterium]
RVLPSYKPLDMMPGVLFAEPMHPELIRYDNNLDDYKARYRSPKMSFYDGQFRCLEKLAQLIANKGATLQVVNMPVRRCNNELLPPGLYARYLRDLAAAGKRAGFKFVDLCQFDAYEQTDFRDSVHLNGYGGIKFANRLTMSLKP